MYVDELKKKNEETKKLKKENADDVPLFVCRKL